MKSANPTCNSINITWSAPNYTGGVPLERYTVRWSGRGSPLMTDRPDVTAVTVTPLSPNTSYTISVTAVNAIGEGQGSKQLKVITIPQGWCKGSDTVYNGVHVHTVQVTIFNCITSLFSVKLVLSLDTMSSRSLHFGSELPLGLETVDVNCTLTAKENSSYNRSVTLNDTTHERVAQGTVDNLAPYTNYTATCLVFKDGVDQCYIGSDTTQTYTNSEYCTS